MLPAFLIFVAVIFVTIFIADSVKFSKTRRLEQTTKQNEPAGISSTHEHQYAGNFRVFLQLFKLPYYANVEGIPNYEACQRLFARLGNNFGYKFPFGSTKYQMTADPVCAKRIMSDPTWPERIPVGYYLQDAGFHKPYGLLLGGGNYWRPASRITNRLLHQLGFFNPVDMEGRFLFEMEELERKFDVELTLNSGEHTFCPRDIFGYLSINVVFHVLLGKRNPFDDATVTKLMNSIMTSNKKMAPMLTLLEVIPLLRHFPQLTFLKYFNETSDMIYDVLREVIAEKRRAGKYKEHVEDFVDGLLAHVDRSQGCEDGLNEENMLVVLRDMLFAGADTTSATLEHALLFMALHPQVQAQVRAEIDRVIGVDRAPSYEDRRRMPYTEATLHEIYRIGSPIPATSRANQKCNETSFALISLYGIHRNESIFSEPNEFRPERFMDNEDSTKIVNTENVMPFGYGRRSCPGETAARVAVFIYFVVMLQKYWIRLSSHHPEPSMKNSHGFSRSPQRYYITIRRRH